MQRILIFNVNWLGDVICSTPAIKAIKKLYPDSYMACLVVPRCRQVLENNPHIDEVIDFDEDDRHKRLIGKFQIIRYLHSKKFDVVYIFHRSFSRVLMIALAGIPWRIGYATKKRGWLLTCSLEEPEKPGHKVDYFLNLVKAASLKEEEARARDTLSAMMKTKDNLTISSFGEQGEQDYEFVVSADMLVAAGELLSGCGLKQGSGFAVLNPGGNWPPKKWPADNFARLGNLIAERTGMEIVITGARKDLLSAREISSRMKKQPVITCGQTDIKTLAGILKLSNVIVTSDTGPMHLAVAVGAKVIALFGPTSPDLTGPKGKGNYTVIYKDIGCQVPCYDQTCKDNRCMQAIKPEEVMEIILKG